MVQTADIQRRATPWLHTPNHQGQACYWKHHKQSSSERALLVHGHPISNIFGSVNSAFGVPITKVAYPFVNRSAFHHHRSNGREVPNQSSLAVTAQTPPPGTKRTANHERTRTGSRKGIGFEHLARISSEGRITLPTRPHRQFGTTVANRVRQCPVFTGTPR
jgi:hypothetical protein